MTIVQITLPALLATGLLAQPSNNRPDPSAPGERRSFRNLLRQCAQRQGGVTG